MNFYEITGIVFIIAKLVITLLLTLAAIKILRSHNI